MTLLKSQHLHFDCASGAAGDMLLAAFVDLGVPLDVIGAALDAIDPPPHSLIGSAAHPGRAGVIEAPTSAADRVGRARLEVSRIVKRGLAAVTVHVSTHDAHHHHAHAHRYYSDIRARMLAAPLTEGTRKRALDTFDRLAKAEAKLHGTTVDRVVFHEVGAIDSIVDIVGCAAALDHMSPASVSCASVAMGHGTVASAHGVLPVPAPAALEVLRECGGVMIDGGVARELCTPTGAAILAAAVTDWNPAPPGRALAIGWGAGDMELADRANVVRAVLMSRDAQVHGSQDSVWQIDANLDDMSPELCPPAADALFAAGALDAWWTPIAMKKGRPALLLSALAPDAHRDDVIGAILRETTTIGVRYTKLERRVLARHIVHVETRFGPIAIKEARDGDRVVNAAPEYESCAEVARRAGVPLKIVYASAVAAYESTTR